MKQEIDGKVSQKRCIECRRRFGKSKMFWKRKFCSKKCRNKAHKNRVKIAYEEYKKRI